VNGFIIIRFTIYLKTKRAIVKYRTIMQKKLRYLICRIFVK
jgi:hypothetical protein